MHTARFSSSGSFYQPPPRCRPPSPWMQSLAWGLLNCPPPQQNPFWMQTLLGRPPSLVRIPLWMQVPSIVDGQTPVKTLPCPKLRLRAVKKVSLEFQCEKNTVTKSRARGII